MSRCDLREFAREGFQEMGRGVVMTHYDQDEVWYVTIEDLRRSLIDAPELEGLIECTGELVTDYDPEWEAVLLESGPEAVQVFWVRQDEVLTIGTLAFMPTMLLILLRVSLRTIEQRCVEDYHCHMEVAVR
jgi:hypothetical protein